LAITPSTIFVMLSLSVTSTRNPIASPPAGLDELDGLRNRVHVDVADGDLGAFLGELDGRRTADALARAGDDRYLAAEAHEIVVLVPWLVHACV
jgi:hypothetical protein